MAAYLQLERDRNTVKDGNYILWQSDMLAFGPLHQLPEILEKIGGIALQAHEAREEQDGTVTRPLPIATDEQFIIEPAAEPEPAEEPQEPEATEAESVEPTEEINPENTVEDEQRIDDQND